MKKEPTIEEMLAKLDEIVRKLSEDDTTLEQALSLYADSAKEIAALSKKLDDAEIKINEITKQLTGEATDADNGL